MAGPFAGVQATAAVKRATSSTYGTAVGAMTNQIPLISESMTNAITFDEDDALMGTAGRREPVIVTENPSGTITTDLTYEGLEYLFFSAFGFENPSVRTGAYGVDGTTANGSPAPDVFATPRAWHRVFELDHELSIEPWEADERAVSASTDPAATFWDATHRKIRAFDLLINKGEPNGYVWRYTGCMVNSMTIRAGVDGVSAEWGITARKEDTALAVASAGTWTQGANAFSRQRAVFPHLTIGLEAVSASAPAMTVAVQEITLTLANPFEDSWSSGTDSKFKIEPVRSGPRKVSGTIKLARYNANTFPTALAAGLEFQLVMSFAAPAADIIKTGANASTLSWVNTLQFIAPSVRFTKANFPVAGPGVITGDIEFECFVPAAYPAWITAASGPARYITLEKSQELLFVSRNSRPYCFSRDLYTGAPGGAALP